MKRSTDETNRLGVLAVAKIFTDLRWTFREQTTSDFGIDAQAEKLDDSGNATGRLLALQIKSGSSWFRKRGNDFVYYGEARHREYWISHSLPVFIVLHDPDSGLTVWQRIERHLVEDGPDGRWSIVIPADNRLDAAHERYILAGIASDEASVRRYRLALDLPVIQRVAEEEFTYLRLEEWINKTLNFRGTEVIFGDDPEVDADLELDTWMVAPDRAVFMAHMFPWLKFSVVEYDDDGGAGEVATHLLEVELSDIGRAALTLEEFYREGAPEQESEGATISQAWIDSIDDVPDEK
jgi:hypothetical protein